MSHNEKFVSEDIFEDENVPKHNLKSMMLNNNDYDDSHTSQFDFIFLSVIFIPLIILFLIFIH